MHMKKYDRRKFNKAPEGGSQKAPNAREQAKIALKRAVLSCMQAGKPKAQIAREFGVSPITITTWWKEFEVDPDAMPVKNAVQRDLRAYKTELKLKAIDAVESGLNCDDDPYRRADIGIKVLRGIGEFQESAPSQIAILMGQIPKELEDEFAKCITITPEPVKAISSEGESNG